MSSEPNENFTEIMTNRSTITNRVNAESALDFSVNGHSVLNYKHETVYTALSIDPMIEHKTIPWNQLPNLVIINNTPLTLQTHKENINLIV